MVIFRVTIPLLTLMAVISTVISPSIAYAQSSPYIIEISQANTSSIIKVETSSRGLIQSPTIPETSNPPRITVLTTTTTEVPTTTQPPTTNQPSANTTEAPTTSVTPSTTTSVAPTTTETTVNDIPVESITTIAVPPVPSTTTTTTTQAPAITVTSTTQPPTTTQRPVTTTTRAPNPPSTANNSVTIIIDPNHRALVNQAMDRISYDWQNRLNNLEVNFIDGSNRRFGHTFVSGLYIPSDNELIVYIDPGDTAFEVARVLAHELGHHVDVNTFSSQDRAQWLNARGFSPDVSWFPTSGSNDFASPAGDFAEAWAQWQTGSTRRSTIGGPFTAEQIQLVAQLTP